MKNILLVLLIAVALSCYSLPTQLPVQANKRNPNYSLCEQVATNSLNNHLSLSDNTSGYGVQCIPPQTAAVGQFVSENILSILNQAQNTPTSPTLSEIKEMLSNHHASQLNEGVINKVLTTLKCADQYNIEHNHILTIIDYSLPSNEKRLWVFDLDKKSLLFNTYVSHGIKSGVLASNFFSNKNNSKASSLGVYKTSTVYSGRHGISLKLDGLERGFNDNANNRAVVMHGGWYVTENFIKKYGRAGRSWGCPAVPDELISPIIHTIKDNSLFVVYYPSDQWLMHSKFLSCDRILKTPSIAEYSSNIPSAIPENDQREDILFADIHNKNRFADSEPVVVMPADSYIASFHSNVPVDRMLRRQINNTEYVALSPTEINNLISSSNMSAIALVVPVIKMVRGYYETQMNIVPMGKIINITKSLNKFQSSQFTLHYENNKSINLILMHQFVRWVGL